MRQPVAPIRSSQSSSAAATKLQEKQKEYEAVVALERASSNFARRMEEMCVDCEVMGDAGIVHGQVLAQWPDMLEILALFQETEDADLSSDEPPATHGVVPGQKLVRIPIDGLQTAERQGGA
ncbi:hypothetical protein JAAARDRAFT_132104 [Jaapia argillacea MUCL 33604]|uniref:DASH complex subunit DAD2 n=1 Tax=Jaapia argillacea MUCL 33604 TaxID=933084 RepID=A0A067PZE7_9AGAM|nr:hypothetical protein JAAARDRAFT_132104 [Jaapia argillacea MUCL 33604]